LNRASFPGAPEQTTVSISTILIFIVFHLQ
jgi:hypothetical protein